MRTLNLGLFAAGLPEGIYLVRVHHVSAFTTKDGDGVEIIAEVIGGPQDGMLTLTKLFSSPCEQRRLAKVAEWLCPELFEDGEEIFVSHFVGQRGLFWVSSRNLISTVSEEVKV